MAGDKGTLPWAGLLVYPLCWDGMSPCSAPRSQERGFLCEIFLSFVKSFFLGSSNDVFLSLSLYRVNYSAWYTRIKVGAFASLGFPG